MILKNFCNAKLLLVFFCVFLLQGCFIFDDEVNQARSKIEEIKSRSAENVTPPPKMKEFAALTYSGIGELDPFDPKRMITEIVHKKCDEKRKAELLEEYPLEAMSAVGTLYQGGQKWVLIQSPDDGTVHKLGVGDHLGKNFGEITKIGDTEIDILEKINVPFKGCVEMKTVLTIR